MGPQGAQSDARNQTVVLVICYGVTKGVQMVWRWPPRGVGVDIDSAKAQPQASDDLATTLGLSTEDFSKLLCPQQIRNVPESDMITIESFSFLIRYFHLLEGNVLHAALAFGVHSTLAHRVHSYQHFLDDYQAAVVREENRCGYLRSAMLALSRLRDKQDPASDGASRGTWTAIHEGVAETGYDSAVSLVEELEAIGTAFQKESPVNVRVNDWLALRADPTAYLAPPAEASFRPAPLDPSKAEQWQFLRVHSELVLPLTVPEDDETSRALAEISGVRLHEIVAIIAAPCTVKRFREELRKVRLQRASAAPRPAGAGAAARPPLSDDIKPVAFRRLLTLLTEKKIALLQRVYYIFEPRLLASATRATQAPQTSNPQAAAAEGRPAAGGPALETEPLAESMLGGFPARDRVGATLLLGGARRRPRPPPAAAAEAPSLQRGALVHSGRGSPVATVGSPQQYWGFLLGLARSWSASQPRTPGGHAPNEVDLTNLFLYRIMQYLDGTWAKEEILAAPAPGLPGLPELTEHLLDSVVQCFAQFITVVIA
eukprot:TRINITY_DN13484_c1_g1_i1.p1 TRINITY_DN13484_c1_g1~~TRINITY_DN13484_c1_g1_i1.p1  ORF type:complete len:543 (+),score=156.67 TRINITY_DN13484_c1_g1_i1:91-1719(+)